MNQPEPVNQAGGCVIVVDPLQHPNWDSLVGAHPGSSVFHRSAWARVLRDTYGHTPFYICRFGNEGQLEELLPVMEVSSPWTGRRGVSLPFTDFCFPLCPPDVSAFASQTAPSSVLRLPFSGAAQISASQHLSISAFALGRSRNWRYLELRGPDPGSAFPDATPSLEFLGHSLDLTPSPDAIFAACDPSVRRAIRKAGKAVYVQFHTAEDAMRQFYGLHCQTRRKHGVPPQPFAFFQNIARHLLASGQGFIATAYAQGRAVAASVFLHAGREAIYKFGASDERFQHLRPNNLVMWEAIKHCAAKGCQTLHLGRTSAANEGLRRFKLSFGTREQPLRYYKFDFRKKTFVIAIDRAEGWPNHLFRLLPPSLFRLAGRLLYPHLS